MTLTSLSGTKHVNVDNSPWWVANQLLPSNPVYIDLNIAHDKITIDSYQIKNVISYDEFKNATINKNINEITETKFNTTVINYSDRNKL